MNIAQDSKRQMLTALFLLMTGALFGYVLALMVLSVWHKDWHVGPLFILMNYMRLYQSNYPEWLVASLMLLMPSIGGMLLSARLLEPNLTAFGTTHWQTKADMKKSQFFANPATGFLLGKTGKPESKSQHIVSARFPHCLLVAPTGAGKTVGFVIPNLLTYLGSAVVLDVKGECFEKTARFRERMGHSIYRFGPRDFDMPSHRFNPLHRISKLRNPAQRMAEIDKLATMFLQAESSQAASFLPNSKDVFIACAILAFEQGSFTLGDIYKLAYGGELDNKNKFKRYARQVQDQSAKLLFQKLGNTAKDTLSAYLSVLNSSGFSPWANPHTCAVTAENNFDFRTFRSKPQTVYFTVPFDDLRTISPLVRMFFSELIASLQAKEPGKDEPFPVMILLDEFQRIGKMPIIVDSLSLLRAYGGNVAIVTQSIPDIDRIYGVDDRKVIQANSGIKLYLTPSEEDTIAELSDSVGTTTKKVTTKSRSIKEGVFGSHITERSEEYPLLTRDDARRLPHDEIIILINGHMPIRAKRLKYYADRKLKPLFQSQDMKAPPPMPECVITEADYARVSSVEAKLLDCKALEAKSDEQNKLAFQVMQQEAKEKPIRNRAKKAASVLPVAEIIEDLSPDKNEVEPLMYAIADLFRQAKIIEKRDQIRGISVSL
ncbi:type IV secretory system conjugative DNA transfer family protein [Ochrobactrum sp. BTU1]|uniref:type IV secretory system conjugative DNA transfer family protein n=1 Tax=Ochrobactrum sp. BTU1 TaxID=2840456 RepID=UPI001C055E56|nr:type IV secretory system conjugative DNA transfer family protein [Ochrobactrum sp. BTU1]